MKPELNPQDATVIAKQTNEAKIKFSEAGLLAGMSGAAYLFCFYYESGYADVFAIPTQLINVSLINLLIFASIAASFAMGILPLINYVWRFVPTKHPYLAFYVPRFLIIGVFPVSVTILLPFSEWKFLLPILILLIGLFAIEIFFLPLITHRKKGGYLERYQAEDEVRLTRNPGLFQQIASRTGNTLFLVVGLLIVGIGLVTLAGRGKALKQTHFPVTNTVPEMVVLRIYGDNMICAPFDRKTREVKKTFSVLKIAEDSKLIINIENIGPLISVDKFTAESIAAPTPELMPSVAPTTTTPVN
jgi:hypothetical protein